MKVFSSIPFFRLILPFILGIWIAIEFTLPLLPFVVFAALAVALLCLNFSKPLKPYKLIFLVVCDLFLFLLGANLVQRKDLAWQETYYGNLVNTDSTVTFMAVVNELPVEKERFIKCELKLLKIKSGQAFSEARGTVLGYFKMPMQDRSCRPGQTLLIKTRLLEVSAPKNPYEFDYKTYLSYKQIYHTAFIDSLSYVPLPYEDGLNAIWKAGLTCKTYILTALKDAGLTQTAYAICAALLTGYDDDIDRSVMDAFSHSGTLHVLSVSGLHTGLIYLALNFLLDLVDKKKRYKLSRFLVVTLVLWFFALITGFSAPVLRAVIMFNLLGLGKIFFRGRSSHQLNILLVSAFVLLVYNPFYIRDIGFLLSYFALFGLIYFQPRFTAVWQPGNRFVNACWQSITASFAATVSTLPITLFYFKQFPVWFFICNLVVVPATFVLLFLALLIVLRLKFLAVVINAIVAALVWFIELFNSSSFGFIDHVHFSIPDLMFLSLCLLLFSTAFQQRSYKQLVAALVLLVAWQCFSLYDSYRAKSHSLLAVYNIKNATAVSVKNKTITDIAVSKPSAYQFSVKPHVISFNYPHINARSFNVLKSSQDLVLFLDKPGYWPGIDPAQVSTLVLCNNFKLSADELKKFRQLRTLVVDASNNQYHAARAEELSRNFGIGFYSTRNKGAYIAALQ